MNKNDMQKNTLFHALSSVLRNKKVLCTASALSFTIGMSSADAAVYNFTWTGLGTFLDNVGVAITNTSKPYYYDATWGYGKRTQISGTFSFDSNTGAGDFTVNPFDFLNLAPMTFSSGNSQSIGGGLMIGHFNANWSATDFNISTVWDITGLTNSIALGMTAGDVISGGTTTIGGVPFANGSALPATNSSVGAKSTLPIGPAPLATSTFNVAGDTGLGTTLGQLSLGIDDGIGGSPIISGPFQNTNFNFDIGNVGSMHLISVEAVPVPAAVWLFGSGLIGLISVVKRKVRK